jgi:predicted 2-oxoglutarate/Fe(II)-dependent dioxygenase YbiX
MHDALINALATVDRPGNFCMAGDLPLTMPGLVVEGLGTLRLPLGKAQARRLIGCCRQAPYGKGTQTLVDTAVRRVWELDAEQLEFTNPKWESLIDSIVDELRQQLGLEAHKLTAHLYKLLVYEKGSFFLPHRDGEKLDRMVATLVVVLPSEHEGGELIVSHAGQQHEIAFAGAASGYELSYAAFYADCEHEVRPIESGHRLCLTYNVVLAKSRGRKGIAAPSYESAVDETAALLSQWCRDPKPRKLAMTLDHRYTQAGLTLDSLKGIDQSRAEVLFEAAERAGCIAHLALVTLWRLGTAECDYDAYSHGWNNSYHWGDDDEDEEDEDGQGSSEYWMGEVLDSSLSVDHWSDHQGRRIQFGEIPLLESEIVADAALDAGDPSEEDFEDYTGNAGMTLERWYYRAAVVIWPRAEHFAVLCGAGTDAALGSLEPMVKRLRRARKADREVLRQECLRFAAAIIDTWEPVHDGQSWGREEKADRNIFPRLLCELDDPDLVCCFLDKVLSVDGEVQVDGDFVAFCKQHGWSNFGRELQSVIEASEPETLVRNAAWLQLFCRQRDKNPERLALCVQLCQILVDTLTALDRKPVADSWRIRRIDRAALLVSSVKAMLAINAQSSLSSFIDHVLSSLNKYSLTDTQLAAIFALESRLQKLTEPTDAISRWLVSCRDALRSRTAIQPVKPRDYRRAHELSCGCGDCRQLSQFLADPRQRELRLPLKKERRKHLHRIIDSDGCDLKHVTERLGRPYTLVCTKTMASYQQTLEIYVQDTNNLARIESLIEKLPP